MSKPDKKVKERFAGRLNARWGIPPGQARLLARVDDDDASGEDISAALVVLARGFSKATRPVRAPERVSRSLRRRLFDAPRQLARSSAPVVKPLAAVSSVVFLSIISQAQESVAMEFFDSILALFPGVVVTAVLIRYLVEAGKKFNVPFVVANPARAQQVLNAIAWLGLGIAAYYGAEGQVLDVVQRFTDAFPGILGLLELVVPMFLSVLVTKGVHEAAKTAEGKRELASPFRAVG